MNGVWSIPLEMSLERNFRLYLKAALSTHFEFPICMLQLLAVCDVVADDVGTVLKLKMPQFFLYVSLSLSLSPPAFIKRLS